MNITEQSSNPFSQMFNYYFTRMKYAPEAFFKVLTDILPSETTTNTTTDNLFYSANHSNISNHSLTILNNSSSLNSSISNLVASVTKAAQDLLSSETGPTNLLGTTPLSFQDKLEQHLKDQLPSCINTSNYIDSIYQCGKKASYMGLKFSAETIHSILTSHTTSDSVKSLASFAVNSTFETLGEVFSAFRSKDIPHSFSTVEKCLLGTSLAFAIYTFANTYFSKKNQDRKSIPQLLSKAAGYTASITIFSCINRILPEELSLEGRLTTSFIGVSVVSAVSVLVYTAVEKIFMHSNQTIRSVQNAASLVARVAIIGWLNEQTKEYPIINKVTFFLGSTIAMTTLLTGWPKIQENSDNKKN